MEVRKSLVQIEAYDETDGVLIQSFCSVKRKSNLEKEGAQRKDQFQIKTFTCEDENDIELGKLESSLNKALPGLIETAKFAKLEDRWATPSIKHFWTIKPATNDYCLIGNYSIENNDILSKYYFKEEREESLAPIYASDLRVINENTVIVSTSKTKVQKLNISSPEEVIYLKHTIKDRSWTGGGDSLFGKQFCETDGWLYFISGMPNESCSLAQTLVRIDKATAQKEECFDFPQSQAVCAYDSTVILARADRRLSRFKDSRVGRFALKSTSRSSLPSTDYIYYMEACNEFIICASGQSKDVSPQSHHYLLTLHPTRLNLVDRVIVDKTFIISSMRIVKLPSATVVLCVNLIGNLSVYASVLGSMTLLVHPQKVHWGVTYSIVLVDTLVNGKCHTQSNGYDRRPTDEVEFFIHGDYRSFQRYKLKLN